MPRTGGIYTIHSLQTPSDLRWLAPSCNFKRLVTVSASVPTPTGAGLPAARSQGDPAHSSVAQATRTAGAWTDPGACGWTNLTCGTTLVGRSKWARSQEANHEAK
jgi:hypothetical protein